MSQGVSAVCLAVGAAIALFVLRHLQSDKVAGGKDGESKKEAAAGGNRAGATAGSGSAPRPVNGASTGGEAVAGTQHTADGSSAAPAVVPRTAPTAPTAAPAAPPAAPPPTPAASAAPPAAPTAPAATNQSPSKPAVGGAAVLARLRQQRARAAPSKQSTSCTFLFASQTGTAEEIARVLHDEAKQRSLKSSVASLNEWTFDAMSAERSPVVVLIAASTGDGDAPSNATKFMVGLKRAKGDRMKGVKFTVMGLGDSNYTRFMHIPRVLRRRMLELGAEEFYGSGEADEVDGLEDIVDAWRDGLWDPLSSALCPEGQKAASTTTEPEAAAAIPAGFTKDGSLVAADLHMEGVPGARSQEVNITLAPPAAPAGDTSADEAPVAPSESQMLYRDPEGRYSEEEPFWGRIHGSRLLTTPACSGKRVLHVTFDVTGSGMRFSPGDAVSLHPRNDPALVERLLALLRVDGNEIVQAVEWREAGATGTPLPHLRRGRSLRHNLLWATDLSSPPSKSFLSTLAAACSDARQAATLRFLASKSGRAAYREDVQDGRPDVVQLLTRYPGAAPPTQRLLEALPPLRPRLYSLTNALHAPVATGGPTEVLECAFRIVEFETHWGAHGGVATNWLEAEAGAAAPAERLVPLSLVPSTGFKPPADPTVPLIMIGPGTGVAPFRGFLQQRRLQREDGAQLGPSWLYFGNWRRDWDFLYEDELEAAAADGVLGSLRLAWSRQGAEKVYVQSLMVEDGAALWQALDEQQGAVYVCGDGAQMAKDVHASLQQIICSHAGKSTAEADAYLQQLASEKRYLRDVWV